METKEIKREEIREKHDKIKPRAKDIAEEIRYYLKEFLRIDKQLTVSEIGKYERGNWDIIYSMVIRYRGNPLLDVKVTITDSTDFEGTFVGWGFGMESVWVNGRLGIGGTMYNYTDKVWTFENTEIEYRLSEMERQAWEFDLSVVEDLTEKQNKMIEEHQNSIWNREVV